MTRSPGDFMPPGHLFPFQYLFALPSLKKSTSDTTSNHRFNQLFLPTNTDDDPDFKSLAGTIPTMNL